MSRTFISPFFCTICSNKHNKLFSPNTVYCDCCGQELSINDRICSNCGANNDYYIEPTTNKETATNKTFVSQQIKKGS